MHKLDELQYIHQTDSADAFGAATAQPTQLADTFAVATTNASIRTIVYACMGDSALGAMIAQTWPTPAVPLEIWRRYDAPSYVDEHTLLIAHSYSGTTEETLSSVAAAQKAGAHIAIIGGGGPLIDMAKKHGYPHIVLPKPRHGRFVTLGNYLALLHILQSYGLATDKHIAAARSAQNSLEDAVSLLTPDVHTDKNPAKQLALEIAGTIPIIYASSLMYPAAYKLKLGLNQSAKTTAWCGELPEFSHNEYSGWTSHPVEKPFGIVDLRSSFEHPQNQKRFELSERLLSGKRPHPHVVKAHGSNTLEHLLYLCVFGDFLSLYVAMLHGVDPTPLPYVNKLKKQLGS